MMVCHEFTDDYSKIYIYIYIYIYTTILYSHLIY